MGEVDAPIGVFDSGVGGLSVHHALVERLPAADFVYLADQAAPLAMTSCAPMIA